MTTPRIGRGKRPTVSRTQRHGVDRVSLNVGGKKFVSAASTLTTTYFASMLSDNWKNDHGRDGELFIDQDPTPFATLLAYMRRGLIKVDDVDTDVLAQAEFLGIDKLLLAVKVRTYRHLHPRFSGEDDDAAAAFDTEHGGISGAISAGLLPGAFRYRPEGNKEYSVMTLPSEEVDVSDQVHIQPQTGEIVSEDGTIPFLAALNWLHSHGYTKYEAQMDKEDRYASNLTFSRVRQSDASHRSCSDNASATDILIPSGDASFDPAETNWQKQFALALYEMQSANIIYAPGSNETSVATITADSAWLEQNAFTTREKRLENMFKFFIDKLLEEAFPNAEIPDDRSFRIYSRKLGYLQI